MNFWNKNRNNDRINSLSKSLYGDDNTLLTGGVSQNDYNDGGSSRIFSNYYDNNQNTNDNSNGLSFSQGAGLMSKFGVGGNSGGGTPWGAIASGARSGYDTLTGKDASEYSDLEQSTIYPMQGAAIGSQFGPWGTAAGTLYGLGYSLKDNIGLEDNDWLTDVLFPIGMGDEHQGLMQL